MLRNIYVTDDHSYVPFVKSICYPSFIIRDLSLNITCYRMVNISSKSSQWSKNRLPSRSTRYHFRVQLNSYCSISCFLRIIYWAIVFFLFPFFKHLYQPPFYLWISITRYVPHNWLLEQSKPSILSFRNSQCLINYYMYMMVFVINTLALHARIIN